MALATLLLGLALGFSIGYWARGKLTITIKPVPKKDDKPVA
jgi:hypothetical protein